MPPRIQLAETAELKKFAEEKERAIKQRDIQLSQLDDMRTRIIAERMENKREGQLLKKQAVEEEEELRQKELRRWERLASKGEGFQGSHDTSP